MVDWKSRVVGCTALSAGLRGHSRGGGLQRLGDLSLKG